MCSCTLVCNEPVKVNRYQNQELAYGFCNDHEGFNHNPIRRLILFWILGIMAPSTLLTWVVTRQFAISLVAAFAIPFFAIGQGSLGILIYRLYYGDAPIPISPSHGVVQVASPISSTAEQCQRKVESVTHSATPLLTGTSEDGKAASKKICSCEEQKPLRLLIIGDSLAIGVGQSSSCTPVFPEVVARTLSRRMNGRVVYWTCHGAPGASTGWIVRELEQSSKTRSVVSLGAEIENCSKEATSKNMNAGVFDKSDDLTDTDESTSDETSTAGSDEDDLLPCTHGYGGNNNKSSDFRKGLARHRKRFEQSEMLGPYDIVVVVTGSNDLKSAFFPFLLDGEDAKLRKEAAQRGGNYLVELKRLSETIYRRMRNIRSRASLGGGSVVKNGEETIEYTMNLPLSNKDERLKNVDEPSVATQNMPNEVITGLPLLVLPGLCARALPIFRRAPLRWLAIPIVDILDMNKQKYAASNKANVLFVPAASVNDMECYEKKAGLFWREKCEENLHVCLRDVRRQDAKRLNNDLRTYHSAKPLDWKGVILSVFYQLFAASGKGPASSMFSIDSVHPNERGYDFWGRYIGNAICDWIQSKQS